MAERFVCPSCAAALTLKNPVAPGKAIRCPKCQKTFKPEASAEPASPRKAAPAAPPSRKAEDSRPARRERDDRDRDDRRRDGDEPPRARSKRRDEEEKPAKKSAVLLWSLIGVGVLVLGGGTVGVLWSLGMFGGSNTKPIAVNTKPDTKPRGDYRKLIVGRWEGTKPPNHGMLFRADGTCLMEKAAFGGEWDTIAAKYRFVADDRIEIDMVAPEGDKKSFGASITVSEDELVIREDSGAEEDSYRRAWSSDPGQVPPGLLGTWRQLGVKGVNNLRFDKEGLFIGFGMRSGERFRYRVVDDKHLEIKGPRAAKPVRHEYRIEDDLLVLIDDQKKERYYFNLGDERMDLESDPMEQLILRKAVEKLNCVSLRARPHDQDTPIIGLEIGSDTVFKPGADFKQLGKLFKGALEIRFAVDHGKPFPWKGVADLADLPKLEVISFRLNKATDDDLKSLSELTGFKALRVQLWDGEITDEGIKHLAALPNLQELELSSCKNLSGAGYGPLTQCKNLERLKFSITAAKDEGLKQIAGIASLKELILPGVSGASPDGIRALAQLKELTNLDVSGLDISDADAKELSALPKLRVLAVSASKMTDGGLKTLAGVGQLENLSIRLSDKITLEGLTAIAGMNGLRYLELDGGNAVNAEAIKELSAMENLRELRLNSIRSVTPESLQELKAMKKLRMLRLRFMGFDEKQMTELQKALPRSCVSDV